MKSSFNYFFKNLNILHQYWKYIDFSYLMALQQRELDLLRQKVVDLEAKLKNASICDEWCRTALLLYTLGIGGLIVFKIDHDITIAIIKSLTWPILAVVILMGLSYHDEKINKVIQAIYVGLHGGENNAQEKQASKPRYKGKKRKS